MGEFTCKHPGCKIECDSAPADGSGAICEKHCKEHDYEYDRDRRDRFCKHCDALAPHDWNDN